MWFLLNGVMLGYFELCGIGWCRGMGHVGRGVLMWWDGCMHIEPGCQ